MYIVSVTKDGIGEIGSFPSPDYDSMLDDRRAPKINSSINTNLFTLERLTKRR